MAPAVGSHLRENPPKDSSVDDVLAAFAADVMRTAELGKVGVETPERKLNYRLTRSTIGGGGGDVTFFSPFREETA